MASALRQPFQSRQRAQLSSDAVQNFVAGERVFVNDQTRDGQLRRDASGQSGNITRAFAARFTSREVAEDLTAISAPRR